MIWENTQDLFDQLAAPFPVEEVKWRVGPTNERAKGPDEPLKGQPLCYVDARAVMDRLDSVCGPDNWQCTYTPGVTTSIVCNIGIQFPLIMNGNQVGFQWVWKGDGAGASDMEAEKGTLSDAFKRAGVRWGIARDLYELKVTWIALQKRGNTTFLTDQQKEALNKIYEEHAHKIQPMIGVNAYRQAYRLLVATLKNLEGQTARDYGNANQQLIAGLPAQMRDHILGVLQNKVGAA